MRGLMLIGAMFLGTSVAAQTSLTGVPFSRMVPPPFEDANSVLVNRDGIHFVLDAKQNMAWILNEAGEFQVLVALTRNADDVTVLENGELVARFKDAEIATWKIVEGMTANLPSARSAFQRIPSSETTTGLSPLLPAGSKFDDYLSVRTPEDHVLIWRPASNADGILISDLTSGGVDFIDIAALETSLGATE